MGWKCCLQVARISRHVEADLICNSMEHKPTKPGSHFLSHLCIRTAPSLSHSLWRSLACILMITFKEPYSGSHCSQNRRPPPPFLHKELSKFPETLRVITPPGGGGRTSPCAVFCFHSGHELREEAAAGSINFVCKGSQRFEEDLKEENAMH